MKAIVFGLRGCSAGWLGAYGNEWIATPNLDRLAAEGIVFDRHISNGPDHAAACRTWLSGQADATPEPSSRNLLSLLRTSGVPTFLVRANHPDTDAPDWFYADWVELFDVRPKEEDRFSLDSLLRLLPNLLDRLALLPSFLLWLDIDSLLPPWTIRQDVFAAYVEDAEEEPDYPLAIAAEEETDEEDMEDADDEEGTPIVDEAETAAEDVGELLDEEIVEPATPWVDPPTGLFDRTDADAREWLQWSLAALVTGVDAELGVVFEQLRTRGFDGTAAWLLTSDFGYPLGEHGQIGTYRPWLYEELVHLPLFMRLPNAEERCRRVAALTQPQDLAPTLLELLGQAPLPVAATVGMSLLPFARGVREMGRDCAISRLETAAATELAIRTDEWTFLLPTQVPEGEKREQQLYGKPHDRWEIDDLRSRNMDRADELEERLRKWFAPK